jgi:hypothetical protein
MSCLLTNNIRFCDYSIGGLEKLYLTNKADIAGVTFTGSNKGLINNFLPIGGSVYWLEFDLIKETALTQEELQQQSRGDLYKVDLDLSFILRDVTKRNTLSQLIKGDLVAVLKDANGLYWSIGESDGLKVKSYSSTSDVKGGVSSYSLGLTAYQKHQTREVDFAALPTFWVVIEDCSIYFGLPISDIPSPVASTFDCLIDFS